MSFCSNGYRVALELEAPFDPELDGSQLESDRQLTAGYQFSF